MVDLIPVIHQEYRLLFLVFYGARYTCPAPDGGVRACDEAYEKLIAAATRAVEQGSETPNGEWKPREILAHIAG